MKTLGILNALPATPPEVAACLKERHTITQTTLGRCYNRFTCPTCQITWEVDSSD